MSISGSVRPFPKPGNLTSIGEVASYVANLGEWVRLNNEQVKQQVRTMPSVPYADLPPYAGLSRLIMVPDEPTYGEVICYNGVGSSGTSTGWYRLMPAGTAGGASASFPAGGATGQVLAKTSTADYAAAWTNSVGTMTMSAAVVNGTITGTGALTVDGTVKAGGGTNTNAQFSSTVAYLGQPVQLANQTTSGTVGTAGTASAPPATPHGYLQIPINGGTYLMPFYST
jgi:hypothetical protein